MADVVVKGKNAYSAGKFEDAIRLFTEAINIFPTNHSLYSSRSAAYASLSQFNEALLDAQKTVMLKSDWIEGYSRLGDAYFGLAVLAYKNGNELQSDWLEVHCRLGAAYVRLALLSYKKALKIHPKDVLQLKTVIKQVKHLIEEISEGPEFYTFTKLKLNFFKVIVEIQNNMAILTGNKDRVPILENLEGNRVGNHSEPCPELIEIVAEDNKYEKCIQNCDKTVMPEPAMKELQQKVYSFSYGRDAYFAKLGTMAKGLQKANIHFMLDLKYTKMLHTYQSGDCVGRCKEKSDGASCRDFANDVEDNQLHIENYEISNLSQPELNVIEEIYIDNCRELENLLVEKKPNTSIQSEDDLEYHYNSRMLILSYMSTVMKGNELLHDEIKAIEKKIEDLMGEVTEEQQHVRELQNIHASMKRLKAKAGI